jgi:DNA-binding transcriptional ArsR family regulator
VIERRDFVLSGRAVRPLTLVLRDAGLVSGAKRGRWIDYSLAPDGVDLVTVLPWQQDATV